MARKKRSSPYDDEAGRGTGEFDAAPTPSPANVNPAGVSVASPAIAEASMSAPDLTHQEVAEGMPSSGLLGALVSVLFFFPMGIFAVAAALQVRSRWKRGDKTGAREASERAERLTYAAVGIFIVLAIMVIGAYLVYWFTTGHNKR